VKSKQAASLNKMSPFKRQYGGRDSTNRFICTFVRVPVIHVEEVIDLFQYNPVDTRPRSCRAIVLKLYNL